MNSATFQHKALGAVARQLLNAKNFTGNLIIAIPGEIQATIQATPGVKGPVHTTDLPFTIGNKGRAGITAPSVIIGNFDHPDWEFGIGLA